MSTAAAALEPDLRARVRRRRFLVEAGSLVLGAAILIWSLVPVYNIFMVALDPGGHNEIS